MNFIFARILFALGALVSMASYAYDLNESLSLCSDYEMLIVNTDQCVSRCPVRCNKKICYEDGICPCEGFYQRSDEGLTCALECFPGCTSAGGYCASADLCLCRKGFYFDRIARRCFKHRFFRDRCFGRCRFGNCTSSGECICAKGFEKQTPQNFTLSNFPKYFLKQTCKPKCRQNCGLNGYCFLPDMCACRKKHHHFEHDGRCHKDIVYFG